MTLLYTIHDAQNQEVYITWDRTTAINYAMEHLEQGTRGYTYSSDIPASSKIAFIANEQAMSDYHRQLQARIFVPKGRR